MDYKKLIKSREVRIKIMQLLSFIPDKWMVQLQYRIKTGRKLDLKNPQRYTEKLQWYKLYYRDPLMAQCADKFDVRAYVKECGFESILNECYGVFDSPDEIKYEDLPKSFVIKDTLGGGGNSIILVQDKTKIDWNATRDQMRKWVSESIKVKNPGREWVYDGKKHRIIIEKMLLGDETGDLPDYKFFCFDGEPYCLYMMKNYTQHHSEGILGFLTPDFKLMAAHRADFAPMKEQPKKPEHFEEMVKMARGLSKGFPHVRVDFYNIDGQIVFGEMTFFNASGYTQFDPDEFDFELGKVFDISTLNLHSKCNSPKN